MTLNKNLAAMLLTIAITATISIVPAYGAEPQKAAAPVPRIAELLEKAQSAATEKNIQKEMDAYRVMVEAYPSDERSVVAYFRLAQNQLELKNYVYSHSYFSAVVDSFPSSPYRQDALIGLGISLTNLRKFPEAEAALQSALKNPDSDAQRAAALYNLGENYRLGGKLPRAVVTFTECWNLTSDYKTNAEKQAIEIIRTIPSENDLVAIADRYEKNFPSQYALLELAHIYRKKSDVLNLERTKEKLESNFPKIELEKGTFTPAPVSAKEYISIGCILPLSGDQSESAAQALKGIQMAFSAQSEFVEKSNVRLTIKDSGGSAESSAVAAKELAEDKSVVAVAAMFSHETLAATLKQAAGSGLPFITPSQNAVGTELLPPEARRTLYQTGVTNAGQAAIMAELAVKKLGLRTFAVLYPNDAYGQEFAKLFTQAVEKNGGTVVVTQKFDPSQTDFREQMTAIGGMDDQHLRSVIYSYAQEHSDKTIDDLNASLHAIYGASASIPRITKAKSMPLTKNNFSGEVQVRYQALFLPASYEVAGLILPTLAFYNISKVQVLGTDKYLSPGLLSIGGKYADDVFFPGEFHPAAARPEVKHFVSSFQNALGETPDLTAARYYDTMMMVLKFMAGGAETRWKLTAALDSMKFYGGVSGGVTWGAEGSMEKIPSIYTVTDGKITEHLPPAPPEAKEK